MRIFTLVILIATSTVIASATPKRLPDDINDDSHEASKQQRTDDLGNLVTRDLLNLSTEATGLSRGWIDVNADIGDLDHLGWETVTHLDKIILQPTNTTEQHLTKDEIAKILGDTNFVSEAEDNPARPKTKRTLVESLADSVGEEAVSTPKPIKNIDELHDWIMKNQQTHLDTKKILELADVGRKTASEWLKVMGLDSEIDEKAKDPRVKDCVDLDSTDKEIIKRLAKELEIKPGTTKLVLRRYRYILKYGPGIYGSGNIEDAAKDTKPSSAVAAKKLRVMSSDNKEEDEFDAEQPKDKIRILRAWMLKNQNTVLSYALIGQILDIKESCAKTYYSRVGLNNNINELASDDRVQELFKTWDKWRSGSIVEKIAEEQGISYAQADLVLARLKYIQEYGTEIYCKRTKKFNGPKYQ